MPKIKRKNNKLPFIQKIEKSLSKFSIGNLVIRYFRKRKSGNLRLQKNKNHTRINIISSIITFRKNLLLKLFAIILIIGTVLTLGAVIKQYNAISFTPYLSDEVKDTTNIMGSEQNVLLTGFKKISSNHFAELIILISLNTKSGDLKMLAINPTFITSTVQFNKRYTLRSLINNVNEEYPMSEYSKSLENLLGIRIDRYIAFDVDQLNDLLKKWDFSMKSIDSFNSSNGYISKDTIINKSILGEYLFTIDAKKTYDDLANRQLSFLIQNIQNNRNIITYFKIFWNSQDFVNVFHTNMTKNEATGFLSALMSSNLPVKSYVLNSGLGINTKTTSEEGLTPNYLEFDAKIKDLMLDINIVREQASIEIYNASSVSGLASKVKRIFQNIGANIINTNNYPEKVSNIRLYVPNKDTEEYSNTINAIQSYFGSDLEIILGNYKYNYTGDLILVLGKDK